MSTIITFFDKHPLFSWFVLSAIANALIDVFGKRDTTFGRVAKRLGTDLKGVVGKRPGAAMLVGAALMTEQACSWFKGESGITTVSTPYGSVQRKGPYVPDPAPTTNVYVWCGTDAGVAIDASPVDAR